MERMCLSLFQSLRQLLPPRCLCGSSHLSEPSSKAISSHQLASSSSAHTAFPASEGAVTPSFMNESFDTRLPAWNLLVVDSVSDPRTEHRVSDS